MLFGPERLDRNIKMMAMIGTGLMATPMANGSESPIACPMSTSDLRVQLYQCDDRWPFLVPSETRRIISFST